MSLRRLSVFERALFGLGALAAAVLLFFFLAAALVVGAIMAVVILARLWWLKRGLKKAEQAETITAEYTVIERESPAQPQLPNENRPGSSDNP